MCVFVIVFVFCYCKKKSNLWLVVTLITLKSLTFALFLPHAHTLYLSLYLSISFSLTLSRRIYCKHVKYWYVRTKDPHGSSSSSFCNMIIIHDLHIHGLHIHGSLDRIRNAIYNNGLGDDVSNMDSSLYVYVSSLSLCFLLTFQISTFLVQ